MVSLRPRVTNEKLLQKCRRHECNNDVISQVPDGTNFVIFIFTSVIRECFCFVLSVESRFLLYFILATLLPESAAMTRVILLAF